MLPRVFDLFAQGDRSLGPLQGGLGIGLTLVRTLVEMHGGTRRPPRARGRARAASSPSGCPPPADPAARSRRAAGPRRPARRPARARRVLVVDDNARPASGLARLLQLLGHEVRVAHDGPAALEAARVHRPEVVLLDIGLPGMDGYEVVSGSAPRMLRPGR